MLLMLMLMTGWQVQFGAVLMTKLIINRGCGDDDDAEKQDSELSYSEITPSQCVQLSYLARLLFCRVKVELATAAAATAVSMSFKFVDNKL